MELRNVKITIQQAANWYSSNNDTLKALALSAFSRDELILYYIKAQSKTVSLDLPLGQIDKFKTLAQLSLLASYLNSITKIEEGYHSYKEVAIEFYSNPHFRNIYLGDAIKGFVDEFSLYSHLYLCTFIVPKGSEYYINNRGEIVSSNIIYTGKWVKL